MKVVKVALDEGKERYYLAGDNGIPIESVLKFIKFKDNTNYAKNTLRMYCEHLKLFFEYLEQREIDFQEITIDDLARFVNWLQNPYQSLKILPKDKTETPRCATTVNIIVNTVLSFYDYALRHEEYSNNISERVKKFLSVPNRNFKGFLYGIAYQNKKIKSHVLKLRVPIKRCKTLKKEEIEKLLSLCNNYRDKFLIILLYETGVRIGEGLSLWLEDFDITEKTIDVKDRGTLENNAEIKTVTSPRKIDISQNLVDMFMEYVSIYHTEKVVTNHVFIKIKGKNKCKAMNYIDVDNLFRALKSKSGIHVTAHMYRHTSLTLLKKAGWEPELLRLRSGHKNIYTVLNTYVHPTDEELTAEFNKTKAVFNIAGGASDD